jgi:GNAT superfamily N-acetyltransferase
METQLQVIRHSDNAKAMTEEEIPEYNIFMMCERLNDNALTELKNDFYFRNCRPDELELWKAFPFDSERVPSEYEDFMNQIIKDSYSGMMDTFFRNTLFACTNEGKPIATCSYWKAYGKINSIHWLKTIKAYEGRGIGRAILSEILRRFDSTDYPIYIHTQPGSFRAIKLYSDVGFQLLQGGQFGTRTNELGKCLPILRQFMPKKDFDNLRIVDTPDSVMKLLAHETTIQF